MTIDDIEAAAFGMISMTEQNASVVERVDTAGLNPADPSDRAGSNPAAGTTS